MDLKFVLDIISDNWLLVPLVFLALVAWYLGAFSSAEAKEIDFRGGTLFY